jgi:hypothetical protein
VVRVVPRRVKERLCVSGTMQAGRAPCTLHSGVWGRRCAADTPTLCQRNDLAASQKSPAAATYGNICNRPHRGLSSRHAFSRTLSAGCLITYYCAISQRNILFHPILTRAKNTFVFCLKKEGGFVFMDLVASSVLWSQKKPLHGKVLPNSNFITY